MKMMNGLLFVGALSVLSLVACGGAAPTPPESDWQVGHGGGGSDGAAWTNPIPNVDADNSIAVAIATAPAKRFAFILVGPSRNVHSLCCRSDTRVSPS